MQKTLKQLTTFLFLAFAFPIFAEETNNGFSDKMSSPSKYVEVNGLTMHYIKEGKLDGPVFVFVFTFMFTFVFVFMQGNPPSSYFWRNVMKNLVSIGRFIAFDLVGFEKSDKPKSDYIFQSHRVFVKGFMEALALEDLVLIIHD